MYNTNQWKPNYRCSFSNVLPDRLAYLDAQGRKMKRIFIKWGEQCPFHLYGSRQGPVLSLCEHKTWCTPEFYTCKACNKDTMLRIGKRHLAFAATTTTTKKEKEDPAVRCYRKYSTLVHENIHSSHDYVVTGSCYQWTQPTGNHTLPYICKISLL